MSILIEVVALLLILAVSERIKLWVANQFHESTYY